MKSTTDKLKAIDCQKEKVGNVSVRASEEDIPGRQSASGVGYTMNAFINKLSRLQSIKPQICHGGCSGVPLGGRDTSCVTNVSMLQGCGSGDRFFIAKNVSNFFIYNFSRGS